MTAFAHDRKYLSQEEQKQISYYQSMYNKALTPEAKRSYHNMAEEIRRRHSYSGGVSGDVYSALPNYSPAPRPTFNPPTVPTIPEYNSKWEGQLHGIINDIRNYEPYNSPYEDRINQALYDYEHMPDFKSPYEDMIKQKLNEIINRPKFSYDPEKDAAYQAFKKRTMQAGEESAENALAGISANTGGRLNTWASSMASKARNNARLLAEEGVAPYEEKAFQRYQYDSQIPYQQLGALQSAESLEFNKYQAQKQNKLNFVSALQNLDAFSYKQYRDRLGDKKDLANFVMGLDNRDFQRYQFMAEQTWNTYRAEYQNFTNSLAFQQQQFENALTRTNMLGYVNNEDSYTLGVPVGTLSQEARQRKQAIDDYFIQQDFTLKSQLQSEATQFKFAKELERIKHGYEMDGIRYGANLDNSRLRANGYAEVLGEYGGGNNVINNAIKYMNTPYVWGGTSAKGIDCSGLITKAFRDSGIDMPRLTSSKLHSNPKRYGFVPLSVDDSAPGDVLWSPGHVALKVGSNQVVEASGSKKKVKYNPIHGRYKPFQVAYRYVG